MLGRGTQNRCIVVDKTNRNFPPLSLQVICAYAPSFCSYGFFASMLWLLLGLKSSGKQATTLIDPPCTCSQVRECLRPSICLLTPSLIAETLGVAATTSSLDLATLGADVGPKNMQQLAISRGREKGSKKRKKERERERERKLLGARVGNTSSTPMLHGLTGQLGSSQQHGASASGRAKSQLIQGDALTTGLQNAGAHGSGEAKRADLELGHIQQTNIISDGSDDHRSLVLLALHVASQSRDGQSGAVHIRHVQTLQHNGIESRVSTASQKPIQLQVFVLFFKRAHQSNNTIQTTKKKV